jgi:membrane fusion protein (multidrug efflux system)
MVKSNRSICPPAGGTPSRAQQLPVTAAGTAAAVDTAEANQQSQADQLLGAQAEPRQAEINLAYTEIRAPIDGKIGRTAVTSASGGLIAAVVRRAKMRAAFRHSARYP